MTQAITEITIRPYHPRDRQVIREIACQTAFLGEKRALIFDDDELLADALTVYFTDYEPESSFVAECSGRVVGYVIGARDEKRMFRMNYQIVPRLVCKAFRKGVFFRKNNLRLAVHAFKAWLQGEFNIPHFENNYPAILHINLDKDFRRQNIGQKLMDQYFIYMRQSGIKAVHLATMSESARNFFLNTDSVSCGPSPERICIMF